MSSIQTPKSASSSSSSSRTSYRVLDSDTTPSPSGGNKSPTFNPRALSNRLTMIEASQALAQASKTLSIAAQAMSKAAASLATVGGYEDEGYTLTDDHSKEFVDWVGSPDWAQTGYSLPPPINHSGNGVCGANNSPKYTVAAEEPFTDIADPPAPVEYVIKTAGDNEHPSLSSPHIENQISVPQPPATWESSKEPVGQNLSIAPSSIVEPPPPATLPKDTSTPDNDPTKWCEQLQAHIDTKCSIGSRSGFGQSFSENHATAPSPVMTLSHPPEENCSDAYSFDMGSSQPTGPAHIILEHGFDLLPALCYITQRRAKTVCLYNYAGIPSATQTAAMLRANITLPVSVPESAKPDRLASVASNFNSAQSGILVWPGCKTLPTIDGFTSSSKIQLIHLGEPTSMNTGILCSYTTTILTRSDLTGPCMGEYRYNPSSLDISNDICNQQGPKSPLQPFRVWLRSRLSKNSYARGFYQDWIFQRRKRNPSESIVDIVRLANQFAEEFLLRGASQKYGEPVGGQLTIPTSSLKGQKLDEAIQAGVLFSS